MKSSLRCEYVQLCVPNVNSTLLCQAGLNQMSWTALLEDMEEGQGWLCIVTGNALREHESGLR